MKLRSLLFTIILIVALVLPAQAQETEREKPRLTLRNLFAAGFISQSPGQFMWLPGSSGFLYQYQGAYHRFDVASGEAEQVISLGQLKGRLMEGRDKDRQQEQNINATGRFDRSPTVMSPDGTALLGMEDNDLYLWSMETDEIRWITDDAAVEEFQAFSPDGTKVAFVKDNDIWMTDLSTGEERRLTTSGDDEIWNGVADWVYEEEIGLRQSFWWSPDSEHIAYLRFDTRPVKTFYMIDHLQKRPELIPQKFPLAGEDNSIVSLGIVDMEGKTTWMDTGVGDDYYIFQADWSASGDYLLYRWLSRNQRTLEYRAADPETGDYKVLVSDSRDTFVNARSSWLSKGIMLHFFDDDSFLLLSERSGWFHIYHFAANGSLIRQLTDGPWMVDTMEAVTEEYVYFTGRAESALEKHLYRVPLAGGGIERITTEPGTHNSWVSPDGSHFVSNHSAIDVQPQVRVFSTEGELAATIKDNANPLLKRFDFNYTTLGEVTGPDGTVFYTAMTLPPGFDERKKYPVMVYVYGGPGVQTVANGWNPGLAIYHQLFAAEGYIVFTLDNRGTFGRGHEFESSVYEKLGVVEVADQITGAEWLQSLPYVDSERMGITGGSYGGYLTLMAMFKYPGVFKAGAAQFPGVDWSHYDTIYTERYMNTPQANPEGYKEANAANFANGLEGHLLITQGMMDNNVHMQQTTALIEGLIKAGKEYYMYFYPQEGHGIGSPHRFFHSENVIKNFFARHLK